MCLSKMSRTSGRKLGKYLKLILHMGYLLCTAKNLSTEPVLFEGPVMSVTFETVYGQITQTKEELFGSKHFRWVWFIQG